jgi:glutamate racemase
MQKTNNGNNHSKPIGVFDSGIGGLTVVKNIMQSLPHEDVIYFGDLARLPYGTKSVATIQKFARETVKFLLKQNVKAIVIACNTIASVAKDTVVELAANIPVLDVITSGSEDSIKNGAVINRTIGVIGTSVTINSNAYTNTIYHLSPNATIITKACPLFVPLIEEGLLDHPALELIAQDYLNSFIQLNLDCLVLGCTHYPLIQNIIQKIIGSNVRLIDPAVSTVLKLQQLLESHDMLNLKHELGSYSFFVTEISRTFKQIGETFLNKSISKLELVTLE